MEALVYRNPWQLAVEEQPAPDHPVHNEVLVRVRATGICGTDVGIISGQYAAIQNVILGHESSGEVAAIGPDVSSLHIGERVVIDPTYYCGLCRLCRTGRQNHCERKIGTETGVSRDGTFATYYKTEDRFLYPIADGIGFEAATLTEPLSCALTGVNQLRTRPDLRTVVLGAGPMGIVYTHALRTRSIGGVLVEVSAERRELAQRVLPSGWSSANSIREAVERLSPDSGKLDLVVDTTGVLSAESIPLLARGGQFLAVGLRQFTCNLDMNRVADESLSIQGSIDSLGTFAAAAHLINTGAVPAESIVTHTLALREFVDGFALLGCDIRKQQRSNHAQALKTVLRPC
jgi:threonine dehydrogenase-like Zn-dependent dehydrogenase